MEVRVQTHLHTEFSEKWTKDSLITMEVARQNKFFRGVVDAFVKMDHHTTKGTKEWKEAAEEFGVTVISGMEADCKEGHLGAIGVDEKIERKIYYKMPFATAYRTILRNGGIPVLVHPTSPQYGAGNKILKILKEIGSFDGLVEWHNSLLPFFDLNFVYAYKLANYLGAVKIVGADAHCPEMVGMDVTVVKARDRSEESIVKSLKEGSIVLYDNVCELSPHEMKNLILEKVRQSQGDIRKKIKYGWPLGKWYMHIANIPILKPVESALLEYGIENPASGLWDFMTNYLFYPAMNGKRWYYKHLRSRSLYKMLDAVPLANVSKLQFPSYPAQSQLRP
jgi:predicted metal-dependent phosphoesterase TrpH